MYCFSLIQKSLLGGLVGFVFYYGRESIYINLCVLYSNYIDPIIREYIEHYDPPTSFKSNSVIIDNVMLYPENIKLINHNIYYKKWIDYIFHNTDTKPLDSSGIDWNITNVAIVTYNYNNVIYKLGLSKNFNDNTKRCDLKNRHFWNKIVQGHIYNNTTSKDITQELLKYMGPNYDFYKFNDDDSDTTTNLNFILKNIDNWNKIKIIDSFGELTIIDLKKTNKIVLRENSIFTSSVI